MGDTSIKPHARQKMRLLTQKKLDCVECSCPTRKRHILLCFHCYCEKCFSKLTKALCGPDEGVLCSVCKTFDPYNQKEEKDEGPPVFCKMHTQMRYLLNCVTCNSILCFKCKMGGHYYHQSESLQSALERIIPYVQQNGTNNQEPEENILQNDTHIQAVQKKLEKYENFLREEYKKLESNLKEEYKKVRTMIPKKAEKRPGTLDAQQEMGIYFQRVKIPFHTVEQCPDEGALEMIREKGIDERCTVADCYNGPLAVTYDDCGNITSSADNNKSDNDDNNVLKENDIIECEKCIKEGKTNKDNFSDLSTDKLCNNINKIDNNNDNIKISKNYNANEAKNLLENKDSSDNTIVSRVEPESKASTAETDLCEHHMTKSPADIQDKSLSKFHKNLTNGTEFETREHHKNTLDPNNKLCKHHRIESSDQIQNAQNQSNSTNHNTCDEPDHAENHCCHPNHKSNTLNQSTEPQNNTDHPVNHIPKKHSVCTFKRNCYDGGYKLKKIDEDNGLATLEKDGEITTVSLLCECCQLKKTQKEIENIDYSEVYKALKSDSAIEIGSKEIGDEVVSVRFTPSNIEKTKLFEMIDFDPAGNLIDKVTRSVIVNNVLGKIEIVRAPRKPGTEYFKQLHEILIKKAYREKKEKNEPMEETCTCYQKVELNPGQCSMRNSLQNLLDLPSMKLNYLGSFCYASPKICKRLCRLDDLVYLPCHIKEESKYFVMRYNAITGCLVKNGRPNDIESPHALYPFNQNELLLASESGIHLMDKDLKLVCKLLHGSYSDVSFEGCRIAALDQRANHVKIVDISTHPPTFESDFHVDDYHKDISTLILHQNAVFVTTKDHKIKKYSLKGELLWQWGSYGDKEMGPGYLNGPTVCAIDKNESLLVVDSNNERVQIVDNKCQWHMLELKEVKNPVDALITDDGMLYVLNKQNSLVYWYSLK